MYTNSAYLHNSLLDIVDKSRPLIVTSCGTYKLYTQKEFTTYRPKGRKDYQLIYVAAGKAHFEIDGQDVIDQQYIFFIPCVLVYLIHNLLPHILCSDITCL